jgi:hypothetical protein
VPYDLHMGLTTRQITRSLFGDRAAQYLLHPVFVTNPEDLGSYTIQDMPQLEERD